VHGEPPRTPTHNYDALRRARLSLDQHVTYIVTAYLDGVESIKVTQFKFGPTS
jgi:hypothetical protein